MMARRRTAALLAGVCFTSAAALAQVPDPSKKQAAADTPPRSESPVYGLDAEGLVEVEASRSLFTKGVRADQTVTVIVPVMYLSTEDAIQTLSSFSGPRREMSVWAVSGRPKIVFMGKAGVVDHAMRFLEAIDVPDGSQGERIVEIISIESSDVDDITQLLQIFLTRQGAPRSRRAVMVPHSPSATKLIADSRTNRLIVETRSPQDLEDIKMLVKELDVPAAARATTAGSGTRIYKAKHVNAPMIANVLGQLMGTVPAGGVRPVILAHEETNALLIRASPEQYEEILRILKELDVEGAVRNVPAKVRSESDPPRTE